MKTRFSTVFYGWWLVGASLLIAMYVGGGVFYGFTAVFEPIADEIGWSYTQISLAASLRGVEMGLLAPFVGIMTDRWGPRRLIFGGGIFAALGLFLLGRTTSLGMFYAAFALIAIGISTCTMTVLLTAVANWFQRRVGIATGIAVSGFGLGGLMVPAIVGLIEAYDWRVAVIILALGMLVLVLPLSLLFRHRPEHYGQQPDGEPIGDVIAVDDGLTSIPLMAAGEDVSARQALKSGAFWSIALASACHVMLVTAVITHVMPYLSSVDVARSTSSQVAMAVPLASIAGRLGFGWFADRASRKLVTVVGFGMMALGLLCFAFTGITGTWILIPFLILFGPGYGGINVMRPALVQEYFGRSSFGTIFGIIIGAGMVGSIGGPALAGWAYDNWGSYQDMWFLMSAVPVVALIAMLLMSPARSRNR
ncbi:MAG: MFS transporter [Dehalococcoidales bacterium]|nr:MAG: MFS transporter [Dehalococcoidales bacterium]